MLTFFFRTDASTTVGAGHVMRCLTLAKALRDMGDVTFICSDAEGNLNAHIRDEGFEVLELKAHYTNAKTHAMQTLALLPCTADVMVIDHYESEFEYESALREKARAIMVIDDLANRPHDCDIVLDGNLLPGFEQRYDNLIPPNCEKLLGPEFTLLREEFYHTQADRRPYHMLICFGGTDSANLTLAAIDALEQCKDLPLSADIVISAHHPHTVQIKERVARISDCQLHTNSQNMATLMQRASLMVGAGGSMHWERCMSQLPSLVVTVADNQVETTSYLHDLGICKWLGHASNDTPDIIAENIREFITSPEKQIDMAKKARQVIPANGGTPAIRRRIQNMVRVK